MSVSKKTSHSNRALQWDRNLIDPISDSLRCKLSEMGSIRLMSDRVVLLARIFSLGKARVATLSLWWNRAMNYTCNHEYARSFLKLQAYALRMQQYPSNRQEGGALDFTPQGRGFNPQLCQREEQFSLPIIHAQDIYDKLYVNHFRYNNKNSYLFRVWMFRPK